jgi:hypothetical protein
MDLQEIPCAPTRRSTLPRIFVGHNPFFLFSALCMLFGIFSLNHSLTWSPLPKYNLLWLILILNAYELLLVGLGIFLLRRGLVRDGVTLLVLEAIFLADCGFLNSEIFTADFTLGLIVNIGLLILAALKLAAIFLGLGLSLRRDPRYALILLQMLFLLAAPGYFRHVVNQHHGVLPPVTIYGVWWLLGLMIAFSVPLLHSGWLPHRRIIGTFIYIPAISIIAHLCTAGWVYRADWQWANLTPLLLGLSVVIGTSDHHVRHLAMRMRVQIVLPMIAILFSTENPNALMFVLHNSAITPLRAAFAGALVVYVVGVIVHLHLSFFVATLAGAGLIVLGKDARAMSDNFQDFLTFVAQTIDALIPTTLRAWGLISVITAFLMLGAGVFSSLRKPIEPPPD